MQPAAGLPPTRRSTRIARGLLVALFALCALGVIQTCTPNASTSVGNGEDPALYAAVVRDLRAGFRYYDVLPAHLRARGYAHASPFNFRPPTLSALMAAFPSDGYARGLLALVSGATLLAWFLALRRHAPPWPRFAALAALVGLVAWSVVGNAFLVHETWAGVAIALSLALASLGLGVPAMLAALAALALRELALPYTLVALVFAFRHGTRAERIVGVSGLLVLAAAYAGHLIMIRLHAGGSLDARAPWLAFGGWRFVLQTARMNLWLLVAPAALTALCLPLSLAGLFAVQGPLGPRVRATVLAYVALFLVVGLPFNHLWGLLYAGPALAGLAFAPAATARLWRQAFPRPTAGSTSPRSRP